MFRDFSLNLYPKLTKVESRHDSTNHASMVVLAAPRIVIVYESSFDQTYIQCAAHGSLLSDETNSETV